MIKRVKDLFHFILRSSTSFLFKAFERNQKRGPGSFLFSFFRLHLCICHEDLFFFFGPSFMILESFDKDFVGLVFLLMLEKWASEVTFRTTEIDYYNKSNFASVFLVSKCYLQTVFYDIVENKW